MHCCYLKFSLQVINKVFNVLQKSHRNSVAQAYDGGKVISNKVSKTWTPAGPAYLCVSHMQQREEE